ncbi:hypothetical protein K3495_g11457, partial [Podosphaera aphanis]
MKTSESDIQSAIQAFNDGTFTTQKAAAKAYNVPRSTFRSRLNGSRNQAIAQQHRQRLSFDQEEFLTEWILNENARGKQMGTMSHWTITFHITKSTTPFLFCLADMDKMKVHYNNLTDFLIQQTKNGERMYPIIRKYGHPFLLLGEVEDIITHSYERDSGIIECHLTDTELRQLHRRFGHPSANKLVKLLGRSGHEFDRQAIEHLTKFCEICQKHSKSPGRFKFKLSDDRDFNSCVYIDVLWIDEKPVLQVVDDATRFQAASWLKSMNAKDAWDTLRNCWIDVYLGPPDMIIHDAGTNFTGQEFKQSAIAMAIKTKAVPTEAHHSIGLVERYHAPLRRAYDVISKDLSKTKIHRNHILQMAVKAVNDTAGPDGLVPTLLVFGAYPRMVESDPPASSIFERAAAIKTAMKEIRKIHANKQVINALNMRNGPNTSQLKNLPLNSLVLVWRESKEWTGPHTLLRVNGEDCVVQIGNHTPTFRTTSVKPYHIDTNTQEQTVFSPTNGKNHAKVLTEIQKPAEPRRSARLDRIRNLGSSFLCFGDHITIKSLNVASFLSTKEIADRELSIRLRTEGKISEPGDPFEASRKKEIEDLINQRVFHVIHESSTTPGERIFNARMVDTIKYNNFIPYEKSRLVI